MATNAEILAARMLGARAIDGDTFVLEDGRRIRVAGMDTSELTEGQVGSQFARQFLENELATKQVDVQPTGEQTFDREVARVTVNGEDLARRMIGLGIARPTFFSTPEQHRAEEQKLIRRVVPGMSTPEERAVDAALDAERAQRPFVPNLAAVPTYVQKPNNAFVDAMQRGADTMQAGLYGFAEFAGRLTGINVLEKFGEEGVRRNMIEAAQNPARIESTDDIHSLADLGTYVLEALGENALNIALMVTGAGAGALTARAAIGKAALAKLKTGALAGAAAADFPIQTGESYTGLKEAGIYAPGTTLVAGVGKTALDVLGVERVLATTFKGLDKAMAADLVRRVAEAHGLKGAAKLMAAISGQAARGAVVGVAVEGPTEGLQEAIDIAARAYHDPSYDIFGDDAKKRIKEAVVKGAAAGGALGGAGRGAGSSVAIIREYLRGEHAKDVPEKGTDVPEMGTQPVPEPQAAVDAQAAAIADPTSAKDTMLVTPGSPAPTVEVPGAAVVETDQGTVITTDPAKAESVQAPQTEQTIGRALYGEAGEEGKPADADRVVEAVDGAGQPVTQIVAGPSNLEAARAEAAAQAPEGGTVRERDPREAIAERVMTREEELELARLMRRAIRTGRPRFYVPTTKPQAAVFEDVVDETVQQAERQTAQFVSEPVEEEQALGIEDRKQLTEASPDTWERTLKEGVDLDELQKLKTKARILQRFIPGLEVETDEKGRAVKLRAPLDAPQLRDVETGASVYDAIVKSVIEGERAQTQRTEWTHPEILSQSKTSAGKPMQIRLNMQALAYFGAALRGRSIQERPTPIEVRDDILAALGWMLDKGFQLQGYQGKKFKAKEGPRPATPKKSGPGAYVERGDSGLLPDDAVVYAPSKNEKWTWGYLTKELPRRISAAHAELAQIEENLRENKAMPRLVQAQVERKRDALKAELKALGATLESGLDEVEPDVTQQVSDPKAYAPDVETEAQQARASARARGGRSRRQRTRVFKGKIEGGASIQKLGSMAQQILELVGYGDTVVNYTDDAGLAAWEKDPRYKEYVAGIRNDKPLARIIFPEGKTGEQRAPLIYISDTVLAKNDAQQAYVLGHELGHLLQVLHFDRASPEVQRALIEALGRDNFRENFADQVATWVVTHREPRNVVEKFFRDLVGKLRELWYGLRRKLKLDLTFSAYMDGLLAAGLVRAGKQPDPSPATSYGKLVEEFIDMPRGPFLPPNDGPQHYFDFNGPAEILERLGEGGKRGLARVAGERRAQKLIEWGAQKTKAARGFLRWGYDLLIRSEASWLQSLKNERLDEILTDKFHHTPGSKTRAKGGTFYQRLDMEGAPHLNKMIDIAKRLFPLEPSWLSQKLLGKRADAAKAAEYKKAFEELRQSLPDNQLTSPIAKEVRQWMYELYDWALKKGVDLDFAPEDFPALFDVEKLHDNKEKAIQALRDAGYSVAEAQRWYEVVSRTHPPFHFVRRRNALEDVPTAEEYGERGHLPVKVADVLNEYVVDNLYDTMASYLHTMIRKGVMRELFGLSPEQRADEYIRNQFYAANINPKDPLAALKFELQEMAATGELPIAAYERIINRTLPNLLGRQYAQLNPVARRVMSTVMVWQNWAKMSLSVLSSIMDIGVIAWKSNKPLQTLNLTLRGLLSKRTREQLMADAKMLGAVRDDVVAHILSDLGTGDAYMTKFAKRWNDRLFQWNGLHMLTSLSRAISLSLGKQALKRFATEADPDALKALELLGTSRQEVLDWIDAGEPLSGSGHQNVRAALFQWVDESVVRPTAAIRPEWGNNPHLMLIWHLKSWMWGYTETVLKQAVNRAKDLDGLAKVLPFVMLGAFTLPLAGLGYELRGWITKRDKDFEPDTGFEYVWEVAQRAGVFGILQLYVDAEEAKDYGRLALISVLGPTASSVEDFFRKDLDYFFMKSLPAAAIVQGLQRRAADIEH